MNLIYTYDPDLYNKFIVQLLDVAQETSSYDAFMSNSKTSIDKYCYDVLGSEGDPSDLYIQMMEVFAEHTGFNDKDDDTDRPWYRKFMDGVKKYVIDNGFWVTLLVIPVSVAVAIIVKILPWWYVSGVTPTPLQDQCVPYGVNLHCSKVPDSGTPIFVPKFRTEARCFTSDNVKHCDIFDPQTRTCTQCQLPSAVAAAAGLSCNQLVNGRCVGSSTPLNGVGVCHGERFPGPFPGLPGFMSGCIVTGQSTCPFWNTDCKAFQLGNLCQLDRISTNTMSGDMRTNSAIM